MFVCFKPQLSLKCMQGGAFVPFNNRGILFLPPTVTVTRVCVIRPGFVRSNYGHLQKRLIRGGGVEACGVPRLDKQSRPHQRQQQQQRCIRALCVANSKLYEEWQLSATASVGWLVAYLQAHGRTGWRRRWWALPRLIINPNTLSFRWFNKPRPFVGRNQRGIVGHGSEGVVCMLGHFVAGITCCVCVNLGVGKWWLEVMKLKRIVCREFY